MPSPRDRAPTVTPPPARRRARRRSPRRGCRRGALVALALATLAPVPAAASPAAGAAGASPPLTSGAELTDHPSGSRTGPATVGTSTPSGTVVYRAPVDGTPRLLRAFDPPPRPWLAGHRGVDLAAAVGDTVRAPAGGVVTFAGPVAGRGVVVVLHDDGRRSSLEPVTPDVAVGDRLAAGQVLGRVAGPAHDGPEPAVHWGVREGDTYVDPWLLLSRRGPVVLLPLSTG